MPVNAGTLYVVGTPIGNLEDITYRAARVLGEVDLIAAEDTRTARVLLSRYEIETPTVSFFKGNEARRGAELTARLRQDAAVALISEAGMPGVSDPGGRLIASCVEADIPIDVIPGPTAVTGALVLSGLLADRFCFLGFLPRGGKDRRKILEQLRFEHKTMVLYESPRRVGKTVAQLLEVLGDRPAALVRELTKLHQEVIRLPLSGLNERCAARATRGEVTLVVSGAAESQSLPRGDIQAEIEQRLAAGQSPREVADALRLHGRRQVYQAALAARDRREREL